MRPGVDHYPKDLWSPGWSLPFLYVLFFLPRTLLKQGFLLVSSTDQLCMLPYILHLDLVALQTGTAPSGVAGARH